jgi:hypothetical protein
MQIYDSVMNFRARTAEACRKLVIEYYQPTVNDMKSVVPTLTSHFQYLWADPEDVSRH